MSAVPATTKAGRQHSSRSEGEQSERLVLGPTSRVGQAWSDWAFAVPFAGRLVALQPTHPVVSAGLEQHSTMFKDPWGRAWDTLRYGLALIFEDTTGTADQIRELHRPITGTGYDGNRYHAWNPAPWAWIHLSTFEAMLFSVRALGRNPSRRAQEEMYEEWKAVGRLYGVREQDMPDNLDDVNAYFEDTIANELQNTPAAQRLWEMNHNLRRPPGLPIPRPLWNAIRLPTGHATRTLLAGSFPHVIRKRMQIRWSAANETEYRTAIAALRTANRVLPDRIRLFPAAYAARRRQASTIP